MTLTGDPVTDQLVPIAARLVGAVREGDADGIEQALADTILATGGRCDPGAALAVVLAAMVPDDVEPSRLLAWRRTYEALAILATRKAG